MITHEEIVTVLKDIGMEWDYKIPRRVAIHSETKKSGEYNTIGFEPDVIWESEKERAVFEIECGYKRLGRQQKYLLGTITLAFLYAKHKGQMNTWFYIVVDNKKLGNQVFKLLHCVNDYFGKTFGKYKDFERQIILVPSDMKVDDLKRYLKKQLKAWKN